MEKLKEALTKQTGFPVESLLLSTSVCEPAAKRRRRSDANSGENEGRITHTAGDLLPSGASLESIETEPRRHLLMQVRNPDATCKKICRLVHLVLERASKSTEIVPIWVPIRGASKELFDALSPQLSRFFRPRVLTSALVVPDVGAKPGQSFFDFAAAVRKPVAEPEIFHENADDSGDSFSIRAPFALKSGDPAVQSGPAEHGEVWRVFPNEETSVQVQPVRIGCMLGGILSQTVWCKESDTLREVTMASRRALQRAVGGSASSLGLPAFYAVAPAKWPKNAAEAEKFIWSEDMKDFEALGPGTRVCTILKPGLTLLQLHEEKLMLEIDVQVKRGPEEIVQQTSFPWFTPSTSMNWPIELLNALLVDRFPHVRAKDNPKLSLGDLNLQLIEVPLCCSLLMSSVTRAPGAEHFSMKMQVSLLGDPGIGVEAWIFSNGSGCKRRCLTIAGQGKTVCDLEGELKRKKPGGFTECKNWVFFDASTKRRLTGADPVSTATFYAVVEKDELLNTQAEVPVLVAGHRLRVRAHPEMTLGELNLEVKNRVKGLKDHPVCVRAYGIGFFGKLPWDESRTLGDSAVFRNRPIEFFDCEKEFSVTVTTLTGRTTKLKECKVRDEVISLKAKLELADGVPIEQQRLLHDGKELCDDYKSLLACGIEDEVKLHLMLKQGK